jgi:hypothetical protein
MVLGECRCFPASYFGQRGQYLEDITETLNLMARATPLTGQLVALAAVVGV